MKKMLLTGLLACLGIVVYHDLPAQELDVIDIESVFKETIPLNLSEIVSSIEYIPLEFTADCVLGDIHNILIQDDKLAVISEKEVFLFSTQGKFLRKIGQIGKGPGEYQWARDIQFHPNGKSIFVLDITGMQIIQYELNGNTIATVPLAQKQYPEDMVFFNNHFYIISGRPAPGMDFIYCMDDRGGYLQDLGVSCEAYGSALHGGFQESAGVMIKENYFDLATAWNDTIFRIHRSGKTEARLVVNYGQFKYPLDGPKGSLSRTPPKQGYAFQHWRALAENLVFIHFQDGRDLKLVIYDMNRKNIIHSSNVMDQDGGILNDIDGGPKITWIPSFQKNNGKDLIEVHSAISFIETVTEINQVGTAVKMPKAAEDVRKLAAQLSEGDNPVVQIMHLK